MRSPCFFASIFFFALFLFLPLQAGALSVGEKESFFVDKEYDALGRESISATLLKVGFEAYFFAESDWWGRLSNVEQSEVQLRVADLDREFHARIYPILTATFGSEWNPGIDQDPRITVLFHQMKDEAGGYTNYANEYERVQYPKSNEREMIALNTRFARNPIAKSFLAHEFLHLITFNQKERAFNVSEEVWLNEARAEYVSTLLGYDDAFEGSNLQRRVQTFLDRPGDSLTEWNGEKYDYGPANLFVQYLLDQYGLGILQDSLKSQAVGIASLDEALKSRSAPTFAEVFTNWLIALFLNDCSVGNQYCYLNPNLKNLRITPQTNFLPVSGSNVLFSENLTQDWAGNWHKVIGGTKTLKLEFQGEAQAKFRIPYILEDALGKKSVRFFNLDREQQGTLYISDFNVAYKSLTIIPSSQTAIRGTDGYPLYRFQFTISTVERSPDEERALITELLSKIAELEQEIARVSLQLAAALGSKTDACGTFEQDLYFGMSGNVQVRCLQEFLKTQGVNVYPEGLVTGNFLSLTWQAVMRFQEKYSAEILTPLGLEKGTGYVGPATRAKMNSLLSS